MYFVPTEFGGCPCAAEEEIFDYEWLSISKDTGENIDDCVFGIVDLNGDAC